MQKSLAALVSAFLVASTFHAGQARAEARLLIDAESGRVLESENAAYPWYPASVTKLMTTYVTLRAIREERITLDTVLAVGPNAAAQLPSKMGFKVGTQLTVDNTLKMMLVHSANDMAVVLAEGVSGSIEKFSDQMNANAQRLGMTQTHYVNPNGLPDDQQVTSARDLAILARALLHEFPDYDSYWHIGAIRLGKRVMRNTNRLLDAYPGADGMKTGFICASGFNLVASASRGDKRLIAVVLGASSSAARTLRAAQMFERGFATNPLSWLIASRGTVDALVPVAVDPPNLRDEICGKARHKPAAEDEDDTAGNDAGGQNAFLLSSLPSGNLKATDLLTSGLASAPIDVHVGPPNKWISPATAMAAEPAKHKPAAAKSTKPAAHAAVAAPNETDPVVGGPPPAKKPAATAKPSGEKAASEKSAAEKPAGDKPKPKATATPKPAGTSDKPKSAASDQKSTVDGDKPKPKPVAAVKPKPAAPTAPTAAQ
jgi:D-alanyl-D-alanine carboxypeptidase